MIKGILSFILIPLKVLVTPNRFFGALSNITRLSQMIKPIFFLVIMQIMSDALSFFVGCFRVGMYDITYIVNIYRDAVFSVSYLIYVMVMMLSFFFFVALLSALWKIMGSKIMGSGSKIEYWTSLQACAYTSISLLMLMACDFYVDIVWGYKYSILFSVIFFWGVYILMVISKQVHRIESWNKRIAIGVIGGVIMLPFYYTWLALHHMH